LQSIVGWSYSNIRTARNPEDGIGSGEQTFNGRLIELIHASQFMRTLLIFVNTLIIIVEVLVG